MIEVSDLTKAYGPRAAIQNLNFTIGKGEIVGFLGPNGAGKSTTMKILTGFMPATSGTAKVAGFDVFSQAIDVKRNVGYLPENPPVYMEMIVEDYLEYAAKLHDVERGKLRSSISSAIERTGLTGVRKRIIGNLSKGYRQRVGLAQALVHNPQVLILDEPTVGLDPVQIIEIRELIKGLAGHHTVILSSHILPEVTATCQRIIVINKGHIVAQDTIEKLTTRMRQGLLFNLQVKNASAGGINAIKSISGVKSVGNEGSKLVIEIEPNQSELRDRIIEIAVSEKMGVLEFAPEKLSLEEVFLQLTTNEGAHS
ncbi:MAG: ATP-binding cassette domain-containing protein [Bdellovibrionales bacterium]|nr:ATP-binding cassette domain-containing protein [Bdellovibrionales bacterium]